MRFMQVRFDDWKPPEMVHGVLTKWNWLPYYPDKIKIGKNVDIGAFCFLQGKYGITIEADVQIGSHCSIYSEDTIGNIKGPVFIGENSRIGSHSLILPGVIIPANLFVKAKSVLTYKQNYFMKEGYKIEFT